MTRTAIKLLFLWSIVASFAVARAATLATGEPLIASSTYFTAEGAGSIMDEGGGWYRFDPADLPLATSTFVLDFSDVRFRSFNQVVDTVSNANVSTYMTATLNTALPRWSSDVSSSFTASIGLSTHKIHFPGVGAPAKLRDFRLVVHHASESHPESSVSLPVRVQIRMRLTDDNIDVTLWNSLSANLAHTSPMAFPKRRSTLPNSIDPCFDPIMRPFDQAPNRHALPMPKSSLRMMRFSRCAIPLHSTSSASH